MNKFFIALLLSLVSLTVLANNNEELAQWQAPTPVFKQDFDWLKLTSDEWLKGDIIAMYDEELEFDSDELGMQTIKLKDVAELRSKEIMSIRMEDGTIEEGFIVIKDGKLSLTHDNQTKSFKLTNLLSIASSESDEWQLWDGEVNLGANIRSGNTEQLDYTLSAEIQRRTSTSRFKSDFVANFSKSENKETGEERNTANNHRLTSYYDWFFSQKIFFRAADFEYYSDEFQNIDYRVTLGVALGYHFIDTSKTTLDFVAGPSYQYTAFRDVEIDSEDTEDSSVLMLGTIFEYEITKDIDFETNYQVQIVSDEAGAFIHHLETGIEIDLANDFELELTLYLDRTDKPKPNENGDIPEENDYRFVVSLGYEF